MKKLIFDRHVIDQYRARMNKIDSSKIHENGFIDIEKLEKEIMTKGIWYLDIENSSEIHKEYYCIVSNLKVYRAGTGREEGIIYVTTVYPYEKSMRGLLVKLERCNPLKD